VTQSESQGYGASRSDSSGDLEALLTIDSLARLLRVSRPTIYRLIQSGDLTPVQVGARKRFQPDDIRRFLENGYSRRVPLRSEKECG
jgi:excisionase family DNA binding protein